MTIRDGTMNPAPANPVPPASQRRSEQPDPGQLAEAVAAVVRAHPAVADLDGGPFGVLASYLPGRRVVGVRVGGPDEPVEVSVVVRLGPPLPQVATELCRVITAVTGVRPIELTINDVLTDEPTPHSRSRAEGCT